MINLPVVKSLINNIHWLSLPSYYQMLIAPQQRVGLHGYLAELYFGICVYVDFHRTCSWDTISMNPYMHLFLCVCQTLLSYSPLPFRLLTLRLSPHPLLQRTIFHLKIFYVITHSISRCYKLPLLSFRHCDKVGI